MLETGVQAGPGPPGRGAGAAARCRALAADEREEPCYVAGQWAAESSAFLIASDNSVCHFGRREAGKYP